MRGLVPVFMLRLKFNAGRCRLAEPIIATLHRCLRSHPLELRQTIVAEVDHLGLDPYNARKVTVNADVYMHDIDDKMGVSELL